MEKLSNLFFSKLLGVMVRKAGWWAELSFLKLGSRWKCIPSVSLLWTGLPQSTHVAESGEKSSRSLADKVWGGCDCWKACTSDCVRLAETLWQKILWSSSLSKSLPVYYWRCLRLSSSALAFPRFCDWSIWGPPTDRPGGNSPAQLYE